MSAIILTINLRGSIGGPKKHVDKQVISINVAPLGSKSPEIITRKIKHTDRGETPCCRKMKLSEELVYEFENSECPHWEKPHHWKQLSKKQRLESHLKRYDEGLGISYDYLESQK